MSSALSTLSRRSNLASLSRPLRHASSQSCASGFKSLVHDLRTMLSPYSGLDAGEIDHRALQKRLDAYTSAASEWSPYAFVDVARNYTRNMVDRCEGKANLLLLVWSPGKGSAVHDHADAHCVMKILQGSLTETQYEWPSRASKAPLRVRKETILRENDTAYMSDKLGLHKVSNSDPHIPAVSLHLYTPPWAEQKGCHVFEEKSGKACHILSGIYSEFGRRV